MNTTMMTRFEKALANNTLIELVREMEGEGRSQIEIYDCFEQFRQVLREAERETDEESVMDVMDCIVGCCGRAKLFSHYLTNDEIEAYQKQAKTVKDSSEVDA